MPVIPVAHTPSDFRRVADTVKYVEGLKRNEVKFPDLRMKEDPIKRFVLLEHLEEGGIVLARGTTNDPFPTGWDIWATASDTDTLVSGTFKISVTYDGTTIESNDIDVDDSIGAVVTALSPVNHVGEIKVGLGAACHPDTGNLNNAAGDPYSPKRFYFHFPEVESGEDVTVEVTEDNTSGASIQAIRTRYKDDMWIEEVHNAVPIGDGLVTGTTVVCKRFSGQWGVINGGAGGVSSTILFEITDVNFDCCEYVNVEVVGSPCGGSPAVGDLLTVWDDAGCFLDLPEEEFEALVGTRGFAAKLYLEDSETGTATATATSTSTSTASCEEKPSCRWVIFQLCCGSLI